MCREPELFTTKHPLLRCGSVCRLIFESCLQCFLGDTASSADVPSACRVDKETLEVLLNKPITNARSSPRCDSKLDEQKSPTIYRYRQLHRFLSDATNVELHHVHPTQATWFSDLPRR